MINVVIPMAGAGSRFQAEGFDKPKPFIDVNGKMMIERVLDGVSLPDAHYTLIIQERFREENGAEPTAITFSRGRRLRGLPKTAWRGGWTAAC